MYVRVIDGFDELTNRLAWADNSQHETEPCNPTQHNASVAFFKID